MKCDTIPYAWPPASPGVFIVVQDNDLKLAQLQDANQKKICHKTCCFACVNRSSSSLCCVRSYGVRSHYSGLPFLFAN